MMNKRQVYEDKFDTQLLAWNAEIMLLSSKANNAKTDTKIEFIKIIEILQGKRIAARMKLLELRAVGDDAWEGLKTDTENVMNEVKSAFKTAELRFN